MCLSTERKNHLTTELNCCILKSVRTHIKHLKLFISFLKFIELSLHYCTIYCTVKCSLNLSFCLPCAHGDRNRFAKKLLETHEGKRSRPPSSEANQTENSPWKTGISANSKVKAANVNAPFVSSQNCEKQSPHS